MTFAPKGGYQKPNDKASKNKQENSDNQINSRSPVDPRRVVLPQMSRPVKKTSFYYYKLFRNFWRWSMATLAFDFCLLLFLPLVQKPTLDANYIYLMEQACIALIFISFSWFIKNWTMVQLSGWNGARGKVFNLIERNPILIVIILILVVGIEVFLKVGEFGILSIILTFIIVLGGLRSVRKSWGDRVKQEQIMAKDLSVQVESFNQKLFLVHLIPLLAARAAVLISALSFTLSLHINPNFLVSLSAACIMLSLMQAEEDYFMIVCPRCGSKTSRFLEQYEACLLCLHNEKRS